MRRTDRRGADPRSSPALAEARRRGSCSADRRSHVCGGAHVPDGATRCSTTGAAAGWAAEGSGGSSLPGLDGFGRASAPADLALEHCRVPGIWVRERHSPRSLSRRAAGALGGHASSSVHPDGWRGVCHIDRRRHPRRLLPAVCRRDLDQSQLDCGPGACCMG